MNELASSPAVLSDDVAAHREQLAVADHLVHPRDRNGEHLRDLGDR